MAAQKNTVLVYQHRPIAAIQPAFPRIPFLLRASVIALSLAPAGAYAQYSTKPVTVENKGSDGRNANLVRSSTRGGDGKELRYSYGGEGARLDTNTSGAALRVESRGGKGGEGHHGVISDTSGSPGGRGGHVQVDLAGSISNAGSASTAHGVSVSSSGGKAGSRRRGGEGGGDGGAVTFNANNLSVRTSSASAAAVEVHSRGGDGNTTFQAATARWSGSDGGNGNLVTLNFNGYVNAAGRGVDVSTTGGVGGDIEGGLFQATGNHGGWGGQGGDLRASLNGLSIGGNTTITTRGEQGHAVKLLSQGGHGGHIKGTSWSNAADGGSGGAGGNVTANLNNVTISTTGAKAIGVWAASDGGNGFWGGGSGLARGGKAGSGGAGGAVSLTLGPNAKVTTKGNGATAVQAVSRGGGGSNGGSGGFIVSPGGDGSSGGSGGNVTLTNAGTVETSGKDAHAIYAASLGGAAGDGGRGGGVYVVGGSGGANSHSGKVQLRNTGTVITRGEASHGLFAESVGGDGGSVSDIGQGALGGDARSNSPNSHGAEVVVTNSGRVSVDGKSAKGILVQSIGGGGGNGGSAAGFYAIGGDGRSSGNGSTIRVTNAGQITTQGEQGYGIHAQSIGGGGGSASNTLAVGAGVTIAIGGKGASAGNGGDITIDLNSGSTISTAGADASAVVAQSIGGGGGDGGITNALGVANGLINSVGGSAGVGGHGGVVNVTTNGRITTVGEGALGVLAQSVGGGGGIGGNGLSGGVSLISVGVGGAGGASGYGGDVTFVNDARIETSGSDAYGALLQSIGGGGGAGGNAVAIGLGAGTVGGNASVAVGGTGGAGANAGKVHATNTSSITTRGAGAKALVAQSVGGGGGAAGTASAFSASFASDVSIAIAISVGRTGGSGGDGGEVYVDNQGNLVTLGEHAAAVVAQSVGGGGGMGGGAATRSVAMGGMSFSGALSIGGVGGDGGQGGKVTLNQKGSVRTSGAAGIGLLAQSIGGGGGQGGLTHGDTHADTANVTLVLGRRGGNGGDGGNVEVKQSSQADILTSGIAGDGMVVQSVGGGGGVGSSLGDPTMPPWPEPIPIPGGGGVPAYEGYSASLSLALGGAGGTGGTGGAVTVTQMGNITTTGRQSNGMVVQSIGGGGGRSGSSTSSAPGGDLSLSLTLGGNGGRGGDAGSVQVNQHGIIQTQGSGSTGLLAQSVGGGGGLASASEAGQSAGKIGINLALGGGGGSGGQGAGVNVQQSGSIIAKNGDALVAQSIGGGGGYAGTIYAGVSSDNTRDIIEGNPPTHGGNFSLAVGGRGGAGGTGGSVAVTNSGTLVAGGDTHAGALLQSVGGGGGAGGVASAYHESSTIAPSTTIQISMAVGGRGGAGGDGRQVTWTHTETGAVEVTGLLGDGVRLQSIGGGGGASGGTSVGYTETPHEAKARIEAALFNIGGGTSGGGKGGAVVATNAAQSRIVTSGAGGIGLVAQSIGGGGGLTYGVYQQGIKRSTVHLGGGRGNGGTVDVTHHGLIATQGDGAHGVLAQSIGGGGGAARVIGERGTTTLSDSARGDGEKVSLTLGSSGGIYTRGAGAYGVLAQSIGGGGGYSNTGTHQAPSAGTISQTNTNSSGNGSDVTLNLNGRVETRGEGATAVVAQSLGGGGGLFDGIAGRAGSKGSGSGGLVGIHVGGVVQALGKNADGIFAQSTGTAAGNLYVSVLENGAVLGGSSDAFAIRLSGGKDNVIRIAPGATVDASSGNAISTDGGSTLIDNQGTLTGSVVVQQVSPGFLSNAGTVNAGSLLALNDGEFRNLGVLSVGTKRGISSSELQGTYLQQSTGTYAPDVNFAQGVGDLLTVTNGARLEGKLAVVGRQHLPGKTVNVLEATNDSWVTVQRGFYSKGNAVFAYPYFADGRQISVGVEADFTQHNGLLSEEQSDLANYLGSKWADAEAQAAAAQPKALRTARLMSIAAEANEPAEPTPAPGLQYADVFDAVAQAEDPEAYADVLDQIANDALQAPAAIIPLAHRMFLNRTLNCPSAGGGDLAAQEQACLWGDIEGNWLTRDGRHHDTGFTYESVRYMIGGQRPLGGGWVAGGGVSYEDVRGKGESVALRSHGHNVSGVAFLRKINGPWSYTGALSAGHGSYDTHRAIQTADGLVKPYADWKSHFAALRLQTAYTHQFADFYVKPALDVDVMYQRVPGYSEKGGGAFNLKFDGASQVRAMISPSIELGGRIEAADLGIRPYLGLGVNWMPDNRWDTKATLKSDTSGDSFRLSQELPSVFAEYRLGMDIETKEGMLLRAEWRQRVGDRYNDRSAQLQLGVRF